MDADFYKDHTTIEFDRLYTPNQNVLRKMLRLIHNDSNCMDDNFEPNDELRALIIDVYNAYGVKKYNEKIIQETIFRACSYISSFIFHVGLISYFNIVIDGVDINFTVYQK